MFTACFCQKPPNIDSFNRNHRSYESHQRKQFVADCCSTSYQGSLYSISEYTPSTNKKNSSRMNANIYLSSLASYISIKAKIVKYLPFSLSTSKMWPGTNTATAESLLQLIQLARYPSQGFNLSRTLFTSSYFCRNESQIFF